MFLNNPFFNYFIVIFVLFIGFVILTALINKNKMNLVFSEIELFVKEKGYTFERVKNKPYDVIIKKDQKVYYINLCNIPSNSSVTINSKNTWCLRYGGKRVGRSYPNKRYMNELIPFLNLKNNNTNSNNSYVKIILLYPSTEKVLKYINESDICEVKPTDLPYGYRVMNYKDFYNYFDMITTK